MSRASAASATIDSDPADGVTAPAEASAYKQIDFRIRGIRPIIMHNGQLADPLNPYSKAMKEITGKKKKTDQDYAQLADLEWEGSLYLDEDRRVCIPGDNLEAAFVDGGKKIKMGDPFKAAIIVEGFYPLEYTGPKDLDKLKADRRFRDIRGVKIQRNRVMRSRPIFFPWSLTFTVNYLPDLLNESQVVKTLGTIGQIVGIGDYKPKYGRFMVE